MAYGGVNPVDIIMAPKQYATAYVVDNNKTLWQTTDTGSSFADVTGALTGVGNLRSQDYLATAKEEYLLVGTDSGVFIAPLSCFS